MGPNTNDKNIMLELAKNGMDVARFNFSIIVNCDADFRKRKWNRIVVPSPEQPKTSMIGN